jgi:hypothetical protein
MKSKLLKTITLSFFTLSCSHAPDAVKETNLIIVTDIYNEKSILNFESTMKMGDAHTGKCYSSVDSIRQFGIGYEYILPDSLKTKNVTVYVSAWVREAESPLNGGIAVSLSNSTKNLAWRVMEYKNKSFEANKWVQLTDSFFYSKKDFNDPRISIGVFGYKIAGKDNFDVDDLQVSYKFTD